ncbi:Hpt domain-containing protein [Maridesulfovibrio zosterae]|uniref:Hpt domain-containing protein n=1 Tax=Maridesulfovibrio zosterae TaxID=82171 RepID=UPI000403D1C3|nr:Hpt domain-containing protein [Maridesulfovibrio zosterae]
MSNVVFNKKTFLNHLGDDVELGNEILNVYLIDAPARAKSLKEALANSDIPKAIKFSHALKGISATIRAEIVTSLAEKVEKNVRKSKLCEANDIMPTLFKELDKVVVAINETLQI